MVIKIYFNMTHDMIVMIFYLFDSFNIWTYGPFGIKTRKVVFISDTRHLWWY